jgi:hypothetical protein
MGEKEYYNGFSDGALFMRLSDGTKCQLVKLGSAEFVNSSCSVDEEFEDIPTPIKYRNTDEIKAIIECHACKAFIFNMRLGGNKRLVRKAYRWHEKLRRRGIPKEKLTEFSCQMALFGANNAKRKHNMWSFNIVIAEKEV